MSETKAPYTAGAPAAAPEFTPGPRESVDTPFGETDLCRVWFRALDANGCWITVNVADATDRQFDRWARMRDEITVFGWGRSWSEADRVKMCKFLCDNCGLLLMPYHDAGNATIASQSTETTETEGK